MRPPENWDFSLVCPNQKKISYLLAKFNISGISIKERKLFGGSK